jgi:5-methylcytosine-specific restriction endonuclease McrA
MKCCGRCKEHKPLEAFTSAPKASDGKHSYCKSCVNSYRRANQSRYRAAQKKWEIENAERILEVNRKRRSTEHFKILSYGYGVKYRKKYAQKIKEKKRAFYAAHPELRRAEYERNKERYIAAAYERHHKIKGLTPENADRKVIQTFYSLAKELTFRTGIRYEVDHIIPISKGGLHHQSNLRVVTMDENRRKGDRLISA